MGEESLLFWLQKRLKPKDASVHVGVGGDDCAHLKVGAPGRIAVTTDTLLEGSHFMPDADPLDIGWKAVAVNLSDMAASGCLPRWATINLGLRKGIGERWAKLLIEGMIGCARQYKLELVGGDTTSGEGPTSISMTVIGTPLKSFPLLRGGAKAGDWLVVTGALGGSGKGRHLKPQPRLPEITEILRLVDVHACIDLSDGLALDCTRLIDASGLGALLWENAIPVHPDAQGDVNDGDRTPLTRALSDGEDFELLFSLSTEDWETLQLRYTTEQGRAPLRAVGRIDHKLGLRLSHADGSVTRLKAEGYQHEW